MNSFFIFLSFVFCFEAHAYSPLVATPSCWNGEDCQFEDLVFEEHCPKMIQGKGYCNKRYNESYRIHFMSRFGSDHEFHFIPNFSFTNKEGKVIYQYNSKGVFYKGKKVCSVTDKIAIPFFGKNRPCPCFFDGPIRYLSSHSDITGGAELVLDYFEGESGWVYYKNEKLFIRVNGNNELRKNSIKYYSKKLADDIRKKNPALESYIQSNVQLLKAKGIDFFLTSLNNQFIILSDSDYAKLDRKDIIGWYNSSSFFRKIFNDCLVSPQAFVVGGASSVQARQIYRLSSNHIFTLKGQNKKMPLSVQCSYLNISSTDNQTSDYDSAKQWSLQIYLRPAFGDGNMTYPNRWLY